MRSTTFESRSGILMHASVLCHLLCLGISDRGSNPLRYIIGYPEMPAPYYFTTRIGGNQGISSFAHRHFDVDTGFLQITSVSDTRQIRMVVSTDGIPHHQIARCSIVFRLPDQLNIRYFFVIGQRRTIRQMCIPTTQRNIVTIHLRFMLIRIKTDIRTGFHHEAVGCLHQIGALHRTLVQQLNAFIRLVSRRFDGKFPRVILVFIEVEVR